MLRYVGRRLLYMIPTLFGISVVAFAIINAPPGDYLSTLVARLESSGQSVDQQQIEIWSERYGFDDPFYEQYWKWISNILFHADFGRSFEYGAGPLGSMPITELLADTLPFTMMLALATLAFTWVVAFPIGIYSAVKQYSFGDYVFTTVGFVGMAIPNFFLALILMYVWMTTTGETAGGLFSREYRDAAWNLGKLLDLFGHLWIPIVVLGTAGTAGLIRTMRANLLDELRKPYVVAARARGIPERRLLVRYPLRTALNPFVSSVGWELPEVLSGEVIIGVLLVLPTTGPLLYNALRSQDMYLAGAIIMMVSLLTVIGTLISDLLLGWLDPRIRLGYT